MLTVKRSEMRTDFSQTSNRFIAQVASKYVNNFQSNLVTDKQQTTNGKIQLSSIGRARNNSNNNNNNNNDNNACCSVYACVWDQISQFGIR